MGKGAPKPARADGDALRQNKGNTTYATQGRRRVASRKDRGGIAKKATCSKFPSLCSESIGENEFLRNIFDTSTKDKETCRLRLD